MHGLVHISTAKSKAARIAWASIVVACFAIAIYMITSSYKEWQESPVSTTITTYPITELKFPTVTVCPPRGSNTALNHLLEKVKDVNFNKKEKQDLLEISKEIFLEIPSKRQGELVIKLLTTDNIRSIANGQASMPEFYEDEGVIILRSAELQGSFSVQSNYLRVNPKYYMIVLNLHDRFEELIGEGKLVTSVKTKGYWSYMVWNGVHLHETKLSMSAAEQVCVSQGGHLASVGSQEEQNRLEEQLQLLNSLLPWIWLGLRRKASGEWEWLNGMPWSYQNWAFEYKDRL